MTEQEYGTIRIPRETYEKHNDRRKELGLSWEQYIDENDVEDTLWTEEEIRSIARQESKDMIRQYQ